MVYFDTHTNTITLHGLPELEHVKVLYPKSSPQPVV
jgi:hypothetical protein